MRELVTLRLMRETVWTGIIMLPEVANRCEGVLNGTSIDSFSERSDTMAFSDLIDKVKAMFGGAKDSAT